MDDKQEIVVTMQISLPKQEATTLAEFLQDLLDMMHIEGIVSFTNEDKDDEQENTRAM